MSEPKDTHLRLVSGGKGTWWSQHHCRIQLLEDKSKACKWSVEVIEDDTFRVFSAPLEIPEVSEHPVRVMTGVLYAKPLELGHIFWANTKSPRTLYAIVYDSNLEHLTSIQCLAETWKNLWQLAKEESWPSVLLPLFGATHASLPRQELVDVFIAHLPEGLELDIYLTAPASYHRNLLEALSDG